MHTSGFGLSEMPSLRYTSSLGKGKEMASHSPVCVPASASLRGRLVSVFLALPLAAGFLAGQTARPPQELLKEAESLHQAGKLDEAIKDYRLFLAQYPDVPQVRSNLGAALAGAGRYEEAIVEYKRALQLQPLPQIQLNLALAYYKAVQLTEATGELKPLHVADPGNLKIALLLGDCYAQLGQFGKAVEVLEPLEAAHPEDQGLSYLLGLALIRDGQVAKGEVLVNKILRHGDSPEAHLMLGAARLAIYDASGAVDELSLAVKLNPKLRLVNSLYGKALLMLGHREEAMHYFREELAIDPNEFVSNLYLGVLLNQGEQYQEAIPFLVRALHVRPGDAAVRYQLVVGEMGMGNLEKAMKSLEVLVKDHPDFLDAHVSLARLYYRLRMKAEGDRERAIIDKLNAEVLARKRTEAEEATEESTAPP
jgi:tetratricopeptide (TPR) repeat protein